MIRLIKFETNTFLQELDIGMNDRDMNEMKERIDQLRAEIEKKEAEKYSKPIQIPFSLHQGLQSYPKHMLDSMRKLLGVERASQLKKNDLIDRLAESIPSELDETIELYTPEMFNLLTKLVMRGGYIKADQVPIGVVDYLRSVGCVYTGTFQGERVLALPVELVEKFSVMVEDPQLKRQIKQNNEWIHLARGLLFHYGIVSFSEMFELIGRYTKEKIDRLQLLSIMHLAEVTGEDVVVERNGTYTLSYVDDPELVLRQQDMRSSVPFYPFSKQQILQAGAKNYVDKNKQFLQLVSYLTKNFEVTRTDAEEIVADCIIEVQNGMEPTTVIHFMQNYFEFDTMEVVQELMGYIVALMNSTRLWILKGHTPNELSEAKPETPRPAQKENGKKPSAKVGRNEPCPCGSGKKYKKCCGKS